QCPPAEGCALTIIPLASRSGPDRAAECVGYIEQVGRQTKTIEAMKLGVRGRIGAFRMKSIEAGGPNAVECLALDIEALEEAIRERLNHVRGAAGVALDFALDVLEAPNTT